jgi:hypothetical protein
MSDEHDQAGELPNDPFVPYDAERIAKETGGEILGTIRRVGEARLDIGYLKHALKSLDQVTIRIYDYDGEPAGTFNLGGPDCLLMIRCLQEGAARVVARHEGKDD